MTQNIYDNPEFFAGYAALRRSREGLEGAPEWPALRAMAGDVRGARVLDLGCGFGWFCRWAGEAGAACVLGVDVSENMLARAWETTADGRIEYRRADLEVLDLGEMRFDLVYSSLALHYIVDLAGLLGKVRAAMAPGGRLVFSVEHPTNTAPALPGFVRDAEGRAVWPLSGYLDEGPRVTDWLAKGVIKQHRTIASYINLLVETGFSVTRLVEWGPDDADIAANPAWASDRQRPPFMLVAARIAEGG